jgi:hypothetical protein
MFFNQLNDEGLRQFCELILDEMGFCEGKYIDRYPIYGCYPRPIGRYTFLNYWDTEKELVLNINVCITNEMPERNYFKIFASFDDLHTSSSNRPIFENTHYKICKCPDKIVMINKDEYIKLLMNTLPEIEGLWDTERQNKIDEDERQRILEENKRNEKLKRQFDIFENTQFRK